MGSRKEHVWYAWAFVFVLAAPLIGAALATIGK